MLKYKINPKPNRFAREMLDAVIFRCEGCLGSFTYKDQSSHMLTCGWKKSKCPRCKENLPIKDMERHWQLDCPQIDLECSTCELLVVRDRLVEHDCLYALIAANQANEKTIEELKDQVQDLMDEFAERPKKAKSAEPAPNQLP